MFPLVVLGLGLGALFLWARSSTPPPPPAAPPSPVARTVGLGAITAPANISAQDAERAAMYPCDGVPTSPTDATVKAHRTAALTQWQAQNGLPQTGCLDLATFNSLHAALGRPPMLSPCPCGGDGGGPAPPAGRGSFSPPGWLGSGGG
jgi:hypothetical protein